MQGTFQNLAYTHDEITLDPQAFCIDLLSTAIGEIIIDNFPNLRRIRASRCSSLSKISIKNCPELECIDLSICSQLNDLYLENLPKLRTASLEFSEISNINFNLPSLECLIIHTTKISTLNPDCFPNLLTIECGKTQITDYSFVTNLKSLLRFKANGSGGHTPIDFSIFTSHPSLKSVYLGTPLDLSKATNSSTIKRVILTNSAINFIDQVQQLLPSASVMKKGLDPGREPEPWVSSMRLIYGPWGIPPCDRIEKIPEKLNISHPPFDIPKALNSILGAVYGSALGDALGVWSEFRSTTLPRFFFETPIDITWSHIDQSSGQLSFTRGTSTDDTDQAVLIMRTLGNNQGQCNLKYFAKLMTEWAKVGISEHNHGYCFDIGNTTRAAVHHPSFLENPIAAAKSASITSAPSNGSTMRTAPVGCFKFWDKKTVINNADKFGRATHYDNRCTCGAIIVSLLVSQFIQLNCGMREFVDIDDAIEEAIKVSGADRNEILKMLHTLEFSELKIDCAKMGYVMIAVGITILALRKNLSYEETMTEILLWGGDADTNAAIAGAVLGAKYGFDAIPKHLIKYLYNGSWIYKDLCKMIAVMGIDPPPNPFETLSFEEN